MANTRKNPANTINDVVRNEYTTADILEALTANGWVFAHKDDLPSPKADHIPDVGKMVRSAEYRPEREDFLNPVIGRQPEAPKADPVEVKDLDAVEHYTDGSKVVMDGYTGGAHALGAWGKLTLRFVAADGTETAREYTADDVRHPEAQKTVACRECGGKGYTEYEGGDGEGYASRPVIENCSLCTRPAPKVEQEPDTLALNAYRHLTNYADAAAHPQRAGIRKVRDDVYAALQDHPAPARDELLSRIEGALRDWHTGEIDQCDLVRFCEAAIAKHKGPQS